jgi:hypothetical protein
MKKFSALLALCAFSLTLTASIAHAKQGDPIPGIPVGLEGDPGSIMVAHAVTNGEGNVTFTNLRPGHYTFVLTDTSTLKVPCQMLVTSNRNPLRLPISETILPGKSGSQAYALDSSGHKLTVTIQGLGGLIGVHLSSAEGTAATPMRDAKPWTEKIPQR